MKKENNLSQTISFRVTDEVWQLAAKRATCEKKSVNEFCRDLLEQSVQAEHGLAPGLQILLKEFYQLQHLLEGVFDLQSRNELSENTFIDLMCDNRMDRHLMLEKYFKRENIFDAATNAADQPSEEFSEQMIESEMSR